MAKAKKKIDRPPVEGGGQRKVFTCKVNPKYLERAIKACKKKYGIGLSSKIEDLLIAEFPEILIDTKKKL